MLKRLSLLLAIGVTVALGAAAQAEEKPSEHPAKGAHKPAAPAQAHPAAPPQAAHPGGPGEAHPPAAAPQRRAAEPHPEAAHAQGHPGADHHEMARERHEFHEHDVHRFSREDLALWRGGLWHREWHGGRFGWWWMVGGVWYFYERPIYPYPLVVADVVYAEPVVVAPVVVPAMPAPVQAPVIVAPAGPPPQQFWYYCDNPPGYYPYVATCSVAYRAVPVPANAAPAAQPQR